VQQSSDELGGLTSTTELLDRARTGNAAALDQLFARLYAPLRRWTKGRLPGWARDLADSDDLVQEALVQTFKSIGRFEARGSGALQAYVRQSILNRIRDELRRSARRPPTTGFDGTEVDGSLSPLERLVGREAVERYERALARLGPRDRDVVIARLELGLEYTEVRALIGAPTIGAARKAAERALLRLAEGMRQDARRSGAE